jgi:hypothetical protein
MLDEERVLPAFMEAPAQARKRFGDVAVVVVQLRLLGR